MSKLVVKSTVFSILSFIILSACGHSPRTGYDSPYLSSLTDSDSDVSIADITSRARKAKN